MWLCLNNAFFSAVEDKFNPDCVLVRARKKEHLEEHFANKKIYTVPGSDYAWRVRLKKTSWAMFLADQALNIDYTNFKNSVQDEDLHDFYTNIWWLGLKLQEGEDDLDYGWDSMSGYYRSMGYSGKY